MPVFTDKINQERFIGQHKKDSVKPAVLYNIKIMTIQVCLYVGLYINTFLFNQIVIFKEPINFVNKTPVLRMKLFIINLTLHGKPLTFTQILYYRESKVTVKQI